MEAFKLTKYEVNKESKYIDFNKVKEGDQEETKKMVEKYLRLVKKLSKVNGYIDEDVMQELLCLLLGKAIDTYDTSKGIAFSTYFYNLARNFKGDYFSKQEIRQHNSLENGGEGEVSYIEILFSDIDLENDFIEEEIKEIVNDIVNNLRPRHQTMIKKYYGFGEEKEHTFKEIGEYMDYSKQYIRDEIEKVKEYIKNRLQWEGVF